MDASVLERALSLLDGEVVLVGLSGGLDSTVLLHALSARKKTRSLRAIHVHHALHADADAWSRHCAALCAALDVELVVERVSVRRDSGEGPEAAARAARHGAFARHLRTGETLALAHHEQDQAETILLRLLRASGTGGLASIRGERDFAAGVVKRPLLQVPRETLRAHALAHGLAWVEDPSNQSHEPDRNYLRHRVVPVLAERWPGAAAALSRSAELLADDSRLLAGRAHELLATVRGPQPGTLEVAGLLALDPGWRAHVLREWTRLEGLPPLPATAIGRIGDELLLAGPDSEAELHWGRAWLRRWRGHLYLDPDQRELPPGWSSAWDGAAPLVLPSGDCLAFVSADPGSTTSLPTARAGVTPEALAALRDAFGPLRVRGRSGGERITLRGRDHSHALKHCLQDSGVAPWRRARLPLLEAGDGELLAAGDQLLSERLCALQERHGMRLRWDEGVA